MIIILKRDIKILENTPYDVISYFLKTLGKNIKKEKIEGKRDKIIEFVNLFDTSIDLQKDFTSKDYEKILKFVSDSEKSWQVDNLMKSFKHLLDFEKKLDLKDFTTGVRTNENPYNLDIINLYQICQKINISTTKEDTIDTLEEKIRKINWDRSREISNIKNNIRYCSDLDLINISKYITKEKKDTNYSEEELKNLSSCININYIIQNSLLTNKEAVVYAFKFFSLDITESEYPVLVLDKISRNEKIDSVDEKFSKNYNLNKSFYSVEKFWKKNVSFLYSQKNLNNIKKYEGIHSEEDDKEALNKKLNENNYYYGRIPGFHKETDKENIISYGIMETMKFETLDLEKLYEDFKENTSFGEYSLNITKLLIICKELEGEIYEKLFDIIIFIKKFGLVFDKNLKNMIKSKEDSEFKEGRIIFEKLYDFSSLFSTKEEIKDLDNISILNSAEEITKYFDKNESFKNLKLLNFENNKFIKANNYYSEVYEDIKSLKDLQMKSKNFIELKSNYYKFSSYYYYFVFYNEELFEL